MKQDYECAECGNEFWFDVPYVDKHEYTPTCPECLSLSWEPAK